MNHDAPFWRTTPLADMTPEQWESLCDGCGRCCLYKLRDDDTGALIWTTVACRLFDSTTCRCTHYATRQRRVPDCVTLTPSILADIDWLPPSCAYALLRDGFDLPEWHPLVSGTPQSVHEVGASIQRRCINERNAGDLEHHLADWPGEWPEGAGACTALPRK